MFVDRTPVLISAVILASSKSLSATSLQLHSHLRMDWPGRITENTSYSTCYFASSSFRILLWWLFGLKRPNKLLSNFPNLIPCGQSAFCSMLNIISSDCNEAEYLLSFWTVPRLSLISVPFFLHSNSIFPPLVLISFAKSNFHCM